MARRNESTVTRKARRGSYHDSLEMNRVGGFCIVGQDFSGKLRNIVTSIAFSRKKNVAVLVPRETTEPLYEEFQRILC